MITRNTFLIVVWLLSACSHSSGQWIAEDESSTYTHSERGDTLEITAPQGLTLWYAQPLTGNYRISYAATVVMQGGLNDRLADLNCFWAAADPEYPDDFFARTTWRRGVFAHYNSLDLFYVGFGGNDNSTTRFRRYYGSRYNVPGAEVKPLIAEYTDAGHLLSPNRNYHIVITVAAGQTTFAVNGQTLFACALAPNEGNGYFGLRLLTNHILISGFKIEQL